MRSAKKARVVLHAVVLDTGTPAAQSSFDVVLSRSLVRAGPARQRPLTARRPKRSRLFIG